MTFGQEKQNTFYRRRTTPYYCTVKDNGLPYLLPIFAYTYICLVSQ